MFSRDAFTGASLVELCRALREGDVSAETLVDWALARIESVNPAINAVVQLAPEVARERAREADRARSRGAVLGLLHGIPMTIKDSLDTAGIVTTGGGPVGRKRFVPDRDAEVVAETASSRRHPARENQHVGIDAFLSSQQRDLRTDEQPVRARANQWRQQRSLRRDVATGAVPSRSSDSGGSLRSAPMRIAALADWPGSTHRAHHRFGASRSPDDHRAAGEVGDGPGPHPADHRRSGRTRSQCCTRPARVARRAGVAQLAVRHSSRQWSRSADRGDGVDHPARGCGAARRDLTRCGGGAASNAACPSALRRPVRRGWGRLASSDSCCRRDDSRSGLTRRRAAGRSLFRAAGRLGSLSKRDAHLFRVARRHGVSGDGGACTLAR